VRIFGLYSCNPLISLILKKFGPLEPRALPYVLASYSLLQALFQYPLAKLSDYYGRINIIRLGFSLFIIGSLIGYYADSYEMLLIGRSLQGAGAVGATAQALLGDYTEGFKLQSHYYLIGIAIILSLAASFMISPIFMTQLNPRSIFLLVALTGFLPIIASYGLKEPVHHSSDLSHSLTLKENKDRLILVIFIFVLHAFQMFSFTAYQSFIKQADSYVYAKMFIFGFIMTLHPLAKRSLSLSFFYAIFFGFLGLILTAMSFFVEKFYAYFLAYSLVLIFAFLLLLEGTIPTLLSSLGQQKRGASMGIYSTSLYLGMTFGPLLFLLIGSNQKITLFTYVFLYATMMILSYKALKINEKISKLSSSN
jgi:MFS family permease